MSFTVYPKEGEPFKLQIPRLVFSEEGLKVYNDRNAESDYGLLSMENIAAILPDNPVKANDPILFHVYLKRREKPLHVFAHTFKADEPPSVRFYWLGSDEEIRNTYVALSEVVAIAPAEFSTVDW